MNVFALRRKAVKLGYRVQSGPWPFYRLVILAIYLGTLTQLIYGAPVSIQDSFPGWYQFVYMLLTNLSALAILVSVQIMRLSLPALYIERAGITVLVGMQSIYMLNYLVTLGVPKSPQTWISFAIIIYGVYRAVQLTREIRETNKELSERNRCLGDRGE